MIRISTLIWLILSIVTGSLLFNFGQKTEDQRHAIAVLDRKIKTEQQSLDILEAEWSYLNRPERLRELAAKHLDLKAVKRLPQLNTVSIDVMAPPPEITPEEQHTKAVKVSHKDNGQFAFSKRLEDVQKPTPPIKKAAPKPEKSFADVLNAVGGE